MPKIRKGVERRECRVIAQVVVVACPACGEVVASPFDGDLSWLTEELVLRAPFNCTCESCGEKLRVAAPESAAIEVEE